MDLNIDQLDGEERKKINALLKERNDTDKNKGVDYIFKQSDDREEFLLGKKIDLNKIVKDDRALMGESEIEFQERMEKRKMMQKMREDPMAIIQLNEQHAHKVALEKQRVHQKYSKAYNNKFQRNQNFSSSDSDSSDCFDKLADFLKKHIDNDEDDSIKDILNQVKPSTNTEYPQNRHLSTSAPRNRHGKSHRAQSPTTSKRHRNRSPSTSPLRSRRQLRRSRSKEQHRRQRRSRSRESHHRSYDKRLRNTSCSPDRAERTDGRRADRDVGKQSSGHTRSHNNRLPEKKPKFSKEEIERRLQEMRDNACELESTIGNLDQKFKKQDEIEAIEVQKNLKYCDEYMFKEMAKLSKHQFSLQDHIHARNKQNQVNKLFDR